MKIILADDEAVVRFALKSMLMQLCENVKIKEVANGEELLNTAYDFHPDIIFADIKMPKMTGLEALEASKGKIEAQWIILSGYSEFEYARTCLRHGVVDYLLKPISQKELKAVYDKALEQKRLKFANMVEKSRNDFLYLLHSERSEKDYVRLGKYITAEVMVVDGNATQNTELIGEELVNICMKVFDEEEIPFWIKYSDLVYIFVCELQHEKWEKEKRFSFCMDHLRLKLSQSCITSYQTEICDLTEQLFKQIRQIMNLKYFRLLSHLGGSSDIGELKDQLVSTEIELLTLAEHIEFFVRADRQRDYMHGVHIMQRIESTMESMKQDKLEELRIWDFLRTVYPKMEWTRETIFRNLEQILDQMKAGPDYENGTNVIKGVKEYIDKYYQKPITVQWLAGKFHISPNYLSTLFKKETSVNIVKYINQMRIKEGEHLLRKTDLPVKVISEKVGFSSARYFTKLFYEQYKCYPSDIRKKKRGD